MKFLILVNQLRKKRLIIVLTVFFTAIPYLFGLLENLITNISYDYTSSLPLINFISLVSFVLHPLYYLAIAILERITDWIDLNLYFFNIIAVILSIILSFVWAIIILAVIKIWKKRKIITSIFILLAYIISYFALLSISGQIEDVRVIIYDNIYLEHPVQVDYALPLGQAQYYGIKDSIQTSFFRIDDKVYFSQGYDLYYPKYYLVQDADADSFEIIDGNYEKDNFSVFAHGTKIRWADPETFQPLDWPFAKDKNYVYHSLTKRIRDADPETFMTYQGGAFAKDKSHVYYTSMANIIQDADPETMEFLGNDYSKDENHVFFRNEIRHQYDAESFQVFNRTYLKDKNGVYYEGNIIPNADPNTFENVGGNYYRDKDNIFCNGKLMDNAGTSTFEIINQPNVETYNAYARDSEGIFYFCDKYDSIDPKTFEIIDTRESYYRDKDRVYHKFIPIEGADPGTFQSFNSFYQKDKNSVYLKGEKFEDGDAATFEIRLGGSDYAEDSKYKYHFGEVIEKK